MTAICETTQAKVGLFPGLLRASYEQIDAVNVSSLTEFERSAAHARAALLHPKKPTDAMEFGTAAHCAVLEPERFFRDYAVAPKCDRRTNEGKRAWAEWEAEHANIEALDADEFNNVQRMRDAIYAHPVAKQLLGGAGHNEVGIVFESSFESISGEETTLLCKSLIDRIGQYDGWTVIIDLKSCVDAGRFAFSKSVKKFHYGARAAFYLDGCYAVAPRSRRFMWVAVEKAPPFAVAVYEPDETAIAAGRAKYMRWLRLLEEARRTNQWPAYPSEVQPMSAEDTEWWS